MRLLITGSEGFIGKALVESLTLNKKNYEIFTLDRNGAGINHLQLDLNSNELEKTINEINPKVVVHLAGNVSVPFSISNPMGDFDSNLRATLNLLMALRTTSCNTFIYATSGGAIYDLNSSHPHKEQSPTWPISPYGVSKLAAEGYVRVLCQAASINWTSLAISNCYGEVKRQRAGVIFNLWETIQAHNRPVVMGVNSSRDFIYISDVISAITMSIETPVNSRLNISSNTSTRIYDLQNKIQRILNTSLTPILKDPEQGQIIRSQLDNSKAKQLLGWEPRVDLDKGLGLSL